MILTYLMQLVFEHKPKKISVFYINYLPSAYKQNSLFLFTGSFPCSFYNSLSV